MKRNIIYLLLVSGLALLSNAMLTSCNPEDLTDANDVLTVKSVLPTKVMEGQVVTITGIGLEKVTSVVFPGGITVTDIAKIGNGYISVVTPAGISEEGAITVEAGDESALSAMTLTVGKPEVSTVAPLDKAIMINECVEVYGKDLEFITKAYFPGEDGKDIIVPSKDFKRKATGCLLIYSPMGISEGPAQIVLEDCSGKKYTLPEVTLSAEISGGEEETGGERYFPVWEGEHFVDWNWWYMGSWEMNLEGIPLHAGLMMRITFDNPNGANLCVCDGWWGQVDLGDGNNNVHFDAGVTQVEFAITEQMVATLQDGSGIILGGDDIIIRKIEIFREYPTLWSGEKYATDWWYIAVKDLDLTYIKPEAGQIIRFDFVHHDDEQNFILCDGWWGAPFIREGGQDPNNIMIAPGEDFLEFEISDQMATTMNSENGDDTALIIGGNTTITRISIVVDWE